MQRDRAADGQAWALEAEASAPTVTLLENRPEAFLIVPTLALLFGQALVLAEAPFAAATVLALCFLALLVVALRLWSWALLLALSAATIGAGYRTHERLLAPEFPENHLRLLSDFKEPLYLEAAHYREPERLPDRTRWYLQAERVWLPEGAREVEGRVLVTVGVDRSEWRYGDRVRLWLRVRPPRNFGNPGSFDYESYLARRGIYLTAYLETDAGVELLSRDAESLWSQIEGLRRSIGRFFETRLASADAALLKALVVGDMGGIGRELREQAAAAGVAHILSISGLHVGMLGLVVFFLVRLSGALRPSWLLRWNFLKIATFCSFLAVLLYTCLAGAMVPTVRSAIMIAVYEFAVLLDREEEVFSSLALAALMIGLAWPGVVVEISFQLSFLAVLFIVWGTRKVKQWHPAQKAAEHPKEKSRWRARAWQGVLYLAVPLLATLGTGPMIAHHFGQLSLAGFVSNPLVVPLVGFGVVPLGLGVGFVSLLGAELAESLLRAAQPLLWLTQTLIGLFASLPLASVNVPIPNLIEVGIVYGFFLLLLCARTRAQALLVFAAASLAAGACVLYWLGGRWQRHELRITHLSVGHGDAAVVEFPGGKVLVIDGGGTAGGEFDPGEAIVAPFLRARKILKVDYVLLSHPRVDHYGGLKSVVEQFAPREFWSGAYRPAAARYRDLERALERKGTTLRTIDEATGCREIDAVRVCAVYAGAPGEDASIALRLTFRDAAFLFAGDIGARDEERLLARPNELASAALKVPRHGSAGASTERFIAAVRPRLAIFSVGYRNPFGLPRAEVVARYRGAGAQVLRTDLDGAIILKTDGKTVRYSAYRSGKRGTLAMDRAADP
ncbi:MAG TPA: DNA internalization-related competence protein ComEC/Rec2 [Candidatus Acidoferrales bacterium]|nr:DNA internalization-related competence protein ComEC/Rec2 [Candidatus Acidoferrales bacterium]